MPGNEAALPADTFAVGDVWLLKYKSNEIDDAGQSGPACAIKFNNFVNGEGLSTDLVFWYRTGAYHEGGDLDDCHPGGPDARAVRGLGCRPAEATEDRFGSPDSSSEPFRGAGVGLGKLEMLRFRREDSCRFAAGFLPPLSSAPRPPTARPSRRRTSDDQAR